MKKTVFRLPVLVMILFIFSNSLTPAVSSNSASLSITELIFPFLHAMKLYPSVDTLNFIIRKLAHFSEYACLGILVMGAIHFAPLKFRKKECFFYFLIPVVDESLQLITEGRSCEIRDMLIDSAGLFTGFVLTVLFFRIVLHFRHKKQED